MPAAISNPRFMLRHLLPEKEQEPKESVYAVRAGDLES
jgi:hypothetical protein